MDDYIRFTGSLVHFQEYLHVPVYLEAFCAEKVRTGVIIVLYKWEKDISNKYQDILYYYIARKSKQEITCTCTYLCRYARLQIICELR